MKRLLLLISAFQLSAFQFSVAQGLSISGLPTKPAPSPADYFPIIDAAEHAATPLSPNVHKALISGLGIPYRTHVAKTTAFTVLGTDKGTVFEITTGSSNVVVTFDSTTQVDGFFVVLRKADSGTGLVTNNKTVSALGMSGHEYEIRCDGSNYFERFLGGATDASGNYNFSSAGSITLKPKSTVTLPVADNCGEVCDVKNSVFNAKGDWNGSSGTNDTSAINAAISAAPANGTIFVPAGNYKFTSGLVLNGKTMILDSGTTLTFLASGTATAIEVQQSGAILGNGQIVSGRSAWDASNPQTGILLSASDGRVEVKNVQGFETGISLIGAGQGCAYNNVLVRYVSDCIKSFNLDATTVSSVKGWVNQNYIHVDRQFFYSTRISSDPTNCANSYGVYIDSHTTNVPNANTFEGSIENGAIGMRLAGANNRIEGLRFELPPGYIAKIDIENPTGGGTTQFNWWFGAYGGQTWTTNATFTDGVITGGTNLYSPTAAFTSAVNGKLVICTGVPNNTTMTYVDVNNVTLSHTSTNGSGLTFSMAGRSDIIGTVATSVGYQNYRALNCFGVQSIPTANEAGFSLGPPYRAINLYYDLSTSQVRLDQAGVHTMIWDDVNNLVDIGTWSLNVGGKITIGSTVTGAGSTGAKTINKQRGTVRFAAGATSLVVTDNLVLSTSKVIAKAVGAFDATATNFQCTAANGSFTITPNAAPTAETEVAFDVLIP